MVNVAAFVASIDLRCHAWFVGVGHACKPTRSLQLGAVHRAVAKLMSMLPFNWCYGMEA